jgi:hypothetical protein
MMQLLDSGELLDMMREPNAADAGSRSVLGVDLRSQSFDDDQADAIRRWLMQQPVPIVGLVDEGNSLAAGLDLAVESEFECEAILDNINNNPLASAVLIQVTRVTEGLQIPAALAMESLGYATLQSGGEFKRWLAGYKKSKPSGDPLEFSESVLLERKGHELCIVLNTPQNRNALSVPMRDGLSEAFKLVAMDDSIAQVVVSGNGPCFSAGGDLTEFGSASDLSVAHQIRQLRMPAQYLAAHADKYTVNLHGACIGAGIEMTAFAGHVRATGDTFFQLPEIAMGLIPGAGGCVSIPRRIGRQRTNYLAISGKQLSAQDALSWGLIDEIID